MDTRTRSVSRRGTGLPRLLARLALAAQLAAGAALGALWPAAALAHTPDYPIPAGHFYTQAARGGDHSVAGHAVVDDDAAALWSAFRRLGGVRALGYPASRRFTWHGLTSQATQKGILVWHPGQGQADLSLALDDLSHAGLDAWLRHSRGVPQPLYVREEEELAYEEVKARRLTYLDANPVVKQRFLAERGWEALYGLPVSYGETGEAWVLRAQRVVFYHWKTDVAWARRGSVTVTYGSELVREAGLIPAAALEPEHPTVFRAAVPERPTRIRLPRLGVDAPIAAFGADQIEKDGSLPSPRRADDVAWYEFSGRAGEANNAVFAGHLDWQGRPAVFARIKELASGDHIVLVGDGGSTFTYEVLGCDDMECHLPRSSRPDVDEFVGPSAFAHLTLISCEGEWDRIKRDYSHRRIVRARLVAVTPASAESGQALVAEPLPLDYWVFTADAPELHRDHEGSPVR